jgi:hypothetical protein
MNPIKKDDLLQLRKKLQIEVKEALQEQTKWVNELTKRQKMLTSVDQLLEGMYGEQVMAEPTALASQPTFFEPPSKYIKATDMTFNLLKETSQPLPLDVIVARLKERGKVIRKSSLWSMLYRDHRFKKVGRGLFSIANGQEGKQENVEE